MNATRMTFFTVAGIILAGIWLTGFDKVHWILYLPVALLAFAGMTGICPGLIFWNKLGFRNEPLTCGITRQND